MVLNKIKIPKIGQNYSNTKFELSFKNIFFSLFVRCGSQSSPPANIIASVFFFFLKTLVDC